MSFKWDFVDIQVKRVQVITNATLIYLCKVVTQKLKFVNEFWNMYNPNIDLIYN